MLKGIEFPVVEASVYGFYYKILCSAIGVKLVAMGCEKAVSKDDRGVIGRASRSVRLYTNPLLTGSKICTRIMFKEKVETHPGS